MEEVNINEQNAAQESGVAEPTIGQKIVLEEPIKDSIDQAKEVIPQSQDTAKSTGAFKKVLVAFLVLGVFGGVGYFATSSDLFSGNIFNKNFNPESVESFFPSKVDDFTAVKISASDLGDDLLDGTWNNLIDTYLNGEVAFSKSKIISLWSGKNLEILAAKWNGNKNGLIAAKLNAADLNKLFADVEYQNTFYASVLNSGKNRLIARARPAAPAEPEAEESAPEEEPTPEPEAEEPAPEREPTPEPEAEEPAPEEEPTPEPEAEEPAPEEEPTPEPEAEEPAPEREPTPEPEAEEPAPEREPTPEPEAEEPAPEREPTPEAEAEEPAPAREITPAPEREATQNRAKRSVGNTNCVPEKNFCIIGDYLLLGNSIDKGAKIAQSNGPKISRNKQYIELSEQFAAYPTGLINASQDLFLIDAKEIAQFNKGVKMNKAKKAAEEKAADKEPEEPALNHTVTLFPENGELTAKEKLTTDLEASPVEVTLNFAAKPTQTSTMNIVISMCADNYKNQYGHTCYTLISVNKNSQEISEEFTFSQDTLNTAAQSLTMDFYDEIEDTIKFKMAIGQGTIYKEEFFEGFTLSPPQNASFDAEGEIIAIAHGKEEGEILKYKEGGYEEEDQDGEQGIITLQASVPGYNGTSEVQVSTQICSDENGENCHEPTSTRPVPFPPYEAGKTHLQGIDKKDVADAIYGLEMPVHLEGENDDQAPKIWIRMIYTDINSGEIMCAGPDTGCTNFKWFKAVAEPVFGENAGALIEGFIDEFKEIKNELNETSETYVLIEAAKNNVLAIAVDLAGKYSSSTVTKEASDIYGAANVSVSEKKNAIHALLEQVSDAQLTSSEASAFEASLHKEKFDALQAENPSEAAVHVEAAQEQLNGLKADYDSVKALIPQAEQLKVEAEIIAAEAEIAVAALGDGGQASIEAKPTKKAPAHLIDQWDPTDDTVAGATLLTNFEDNGPKDGFTSHGIHQMSPPFDEVEDWFKIEVESGLEYEFKTENYKDKAKLKIAEASAHESCTVSATNTTDSEYHLKFTPDESGTLCLYAHTNETQNFTYSLYYKKTDPNASEESESNSPAPSESSVQKTEANSNTVKTETAAQPTANSSGSSETVSPSTADSNSTTQEEEVIVNDPEKVTVTVAASSPESQIILEGTEKAELLHINFAGMSEDVVINNLELGLMSTTNVTGKAIVPISQVYIYDAESSEEKGTCILKKKTPSNPNSETLGAICSNLEFEVPKDDLGKMIVKADIEDMNSLKAAPTGTLFHASLKDVTNAYKASNQQQVTVATTKAMTCEGSYAAYIPPDMTAEKVTPPCGKELDKGDVFLFQDSEYVLVMDKKTEKNEGTEEDEETYLVYHQIYDSKYKKNKYKFSEKAKKLTATSGLFVYRAAKPIIETLSYPEEKVLQKNLTKGIYKFKVSSEGHSIAPSRIVFELVGQLGGIALGPQNNTYDSHKVGGLQKIFLKDQNGLTKAQIHRFELHAYDGDTSVKIPTDFNYYYDEEKEKAYLFADLSYTIKDSEGVEVIFDEDGIELELKTKITGSTVNGDFLSVRIPAVMNEAPYIPNEDLEGGALHAPYRKWMARKYDGVRRTLFPHFPSEDVAKKITKFLLYDDFAWSDRHVEVKPVQSSGNFNFNIHTDFSGGWLLESLPTTAQTLFPAS